MNINQLTVEEQKTVILALSIEEALKEEMDQLQQQNNPPENQPEQLIQQTESKPYQEIQEPSQKISSKQPTTEEIPQKESPSNSINDLSNDTLRIVNNTAEKQAKMLVAGTKMIGAYTKLGLYKFSDIIHQFSLKGIQITDDLLSALKKVYGAFAAENDIDELDDMKTVREFKLSDLEDLTRDVNDSQDNNAPLNEDKPTN